MPDIHGTLIACGQSFSQFVICLRANSLIRLNSCSSTSQLEQLNEPQLPFHCYYNTLDHLHGFCCISIPNIETRRGTGYLTPSGLNSRWQSKRLLSISPIARSRYRHDAFVVVPVDSCHMCPISPALATSIPTRCSEGSGCRQIST